MATATQIVVNGLAGPRCTVNASTDWTILQVGEAICEKIGVPVNWQTLLKDAEKLPWEATVGSLITHDSQSLELTLLVQEVPDPEPGALWAAIKRREEAEVLQLLQLPQVPGLNDRDRAEQSALHVAISRRLPEAARAIAAKPSLSEINAMDFFGQTALYSAAQEGLLSVCEAILSRGDFTELLAVGKASGRTAAQEARACDFPEVADLLQVAEEQLLRRVRQ